MSARWAGGLRPRILLSHLFIVFLTTTLYGAAMLILKERLESATYEDMLKAQLGAALKSEQPELYFESPAMGQWQLFFGASIARLPEYVRHLQPGSYHDVEFNGRVWHLEVAIGERGPMFLGYDITEWEQSEHTLIFGMLAGALASLLLAYLLSRAANHAIVAPVTQFQVDLETLNFDSPNHLQHPEFAVDYRDTEIEPIAVACDLLLERINDLVERERSFTATASHELRSSLAVMQGALDVLDVRSDSPSRPPLKRMQRAVDEMTSFVDAALILARTEWVSGHDMGPSDMGNAVVATVERYRDEAARVGVTITYDCAEDVIVNVPSSIASIALGNLIRNAIQHSQATELSIVLTDNRLTMRDNGVGIKTELIDQITQPFVTGSREGTGLGLALVERISERFGWLFTIESQSHAGTTLTITFTPEL